MSRFDNIVNSLLNRLIFEQTADQPSNDQILEAKKIIDETRQEIKKQFEEKPEEFLQQAENQLNTYDYVADGLEKYLSDLYGKFKTEPLTEQNESDWLQDITAKVTDFATQTAKTAGSYIGGAFEKVLDFLTDQAVEKTPSIIKGVMGEDNYSKLRTEIDNMDDGLLYKVIAIFDPTGIMSWSYLSNAKELYEKNLGTEDEDIYTLNLLAATVAVIPGVRAFSIFAVPFKILNPLTKLFGGYRASTIARAVAQEFKTAFNIGQRLEKAGFVASRTGRIGEKVAAFFGKVAKPVKAVARLTASAAKAGTIASGGDIPAMVKGWMEKGKEMVNKVPQQRTFTRIPSFQRLSTQKP